MVKVKVSGMWFKEACDSFNHPMVKIKETIYKFGDKGNMFQPPYGES